MENSSHETAKQIRQEFFVFRNGMLADALKEAGDKHRMIFGLNLSQITDIAKRYQPDQNVAQELWCSTETRECRLIAPMLYPIDKFDKATALKWISEIENTEIADNICHKLLRYTDFAGELCIQPANGTDLERYTALRLAINLLAIGKEIDSDKMLRFAQEEAEKNLPLTSAIAIRLIQDID